MPKHFIANDQLPKQPLTNQAYTVMGADHFVGRSQKNFFRPLGGWGRALPLDPPLYYRTVPSALVLLYWLSLVSMSNSFP